MAVRARTRARSAVLSRTKRPPALPALALGALLAACGDDAEGAARPSNKPRGYTAPTGEGRPGDEPPAPAPVVTATKRRTPGEELAAAPTTVEEKKEEEKPRDYAAELLTAMRGAEACVQPRPASQVLPELSVSLEGLVLESGTVVTGSARAPVLTPEELDCMKRRLESTRLPPGVKDAPRRVSASLRLTRPPSAAPQPASPVQAGAAPAGAANAPALPAAPAPAAANPNEDPPEPVPPQDQDPPEAIPPENQDPPEEVLPSQN